MPSSRAVIQYRVQKSAETSQRHIILVYRNIRPISQQHARSAAVITTSRVHEARNETDRQPQHRQKKQATPHSPAHHQPDTLTGQQRSPQIDCGVISRVANQPCRAVGKLRILTKRILGSVFKGKLILASAELTAQSRWISVRLNKPIQHFCHLTSKSAPLIQSSLADFPFDGFETSFWASYRQV